MNSPATGADSRGPGKTIIMIAVTLVLVVVGFFIYTRMFLPGDQLLDVCDTLGAQSYSCNKGLSDMYRPGDIIQTKESAPDGSEHLLASPAVLLWGSDCFPEQSPRIAPFTLPQSSGTGTASLGINAEKLPGLLSSLQFDSSATVDYSLKLENVTVHTLAKGDLSGKVSAYCIEALERQIRSGDKPEWFSVILESVIAEKLLLEINWKSDTGADARASIVENTSDQLSSLVTNDDSDAQKELGVAVKSEDQKRTLIESNGSVVLGYRARSMQRNSSL